MNEPATNIGSAERLSYALVGNPVNLASRIQGVTKDFHADILISDATRRRLGTAVQVTELPAVRVKPALVGSGSAPRPRAARAP